MDNTGHHKNDGLIRSDFPGGWPGDAVNAFNGTGLAEQQQSMQQYLKQLLNWRRANPVIANGKTLHFAPFDGVYVYFRYNNSKKIMVIMNKNKTDKTIDVSRFVEILKGQNKGMNIMTNEMLDISRQVTVPAKTALVIEVK